MADDYLKEAHHRAMTKRGLNEDEIKEDFVQMLKDLEIWEDYLADKATAQAIRAGEREEAATYEDAPWGGRNEQD